MAKDVSNKSHQGNNIGDTSPSLLDGQKVPPLRIVLNTAAGNQKAPQQTSTGQSPPTTNQDNQSKSSSKGKQQESKQQVDSSSLSRGRFRIKLGNNKHQSNRATNSSESTTNGTSASENEDKQKGVAGTVGFSTTTTSKEEGSSLSSNKSSNYLRRITRRSQRAVQVITNEDEESISSMTSTDENQINQISNSDSNHAQETTSTTTAQQSSSNSTTSCTTIPQGVETPRKYKKRRGETSESLTNEQLLSGLLQNYSLPVQNSFKLFKNIRQQVDKKLDTLNTTLNPKAPRGFREYMLANGTYLLDGNRLGNGVNLTLNENGGMNVAPITRFNSRKLNKVNYFIPDRANVPLDIPRDSPLRDLFVEQEKERYRMRMQHIKEREKLTLAAEQEIMRVYNQAAMASVNQLEPLSVCTMLKHQEIYNYMDSDGVAIQANEENSQDEVSQEGVKTRRRQHDQVSPPQVRQTSNADENQHSDSKVNNETSDDFGNSYKSKEDRDKDSADRVEESTIDKEAVTSTVKKRNLSPEPKAQCDDFNGIIPGKKLKIDTVNEVEQLERNSTSEAEKTAKPEIPEDSDKLLHNNQDSKSNASPDIGEQKVERLKVVIIENTANKNANEINNQLGAGPKKNNEGSSLEGYKHPVEKRQAGPDETDNNIHDYQAENPNILDVSPKNEQEGQSNTQNDAPHEREELSNDSHSQSREMFVVQLQEIDDKWEKIRADMLIRHRNEAESLHAVQRLEWEWKTKEIGAIDVRSTIMIDDVLVPKIAIYNQDY